MLKKLLKEYILLCINVIAWIRSKGFGWSNYNKVWWRKFDERIWTEAYEHFDLPVAEHVTVKQPEKEKLVEENWKPGAIKETTIIDYRKDPHPEATWEGHWLDITERIESIESVLSDDEKDIFLIKL